MINSYNIKNITVFQLTQNILRQGQPPFCFSPAVVVHNYQLDLQIDNLCMQSEPQGSKMANGGSLDLRTINKANNNCLEAVAKPQNHFYACRGKLFGPRPARDFPRSLSTEFIGFATTCRELRHRVGWCLRPDSNRYGDKPQGILSPLCLPFPPLRRLSRSWRPTRNEVYQLPSTLSSLGFGQNYVIFQIVIQMAELEWFREDLSYSAG